MGESFKRSRVSNCTTFALLAAWPAESRGELVFSGEPECRQQSTDTRQQITDNIQQITDSGRKSNRGNPNGSRGREGSPELGVGIPLTRTATCAGIYNDAMSQFPQTIERYFPNEPGRFSDLIDVRSPGEYATDHIPGAINLPVLDDAERARVGMIYKQNSPFEARKIGAALVSRNIARHIESHLIHLDKEYRPLIYCWRGGQRSGSFATVLSQIGFRVSVLHGGYKTYRGEVLDGLRELPARYDFQVLAGATGSGKTRLLQLLASAGAQVLDLEALARHRGSLLGSEPRAAQPSQRWFESQLYDQLTQLDPSRPVWIEAESNKIGNLHLTTELWHAMKTARGVELRVPQEDRIHHLIQEYEHFLREPEQLKELVGKLQLKLSPAIVADWCQDIDAAHWGRFVEKILAQHYDPSYRHSFRSYFPNVTEHLDTTGLNESEVVCKLLQFPPVSASLAHLVN
jgi:tRNA 2-selenouridine synthase